MMHSVGKPLKTFFVITSMHVGGAETLLTNLIRRVNRSHVEPHLVCLKELGPLGEELSHTIPTFHSLTRGKFDLRILFRLTNLFQSHAADAVITVGAGDKMFWGRIASKLAGVGITGSALHSTGWPDGINFANRLLTPWTDAFIAVGEAHRDYLRDVSRLPDSRIFVIPNGIDTARFKPNTLLRPDVREELGFAADDPVVGIVAALRPEKDHGLFLQVAKRVLAIQPATKFLIIGDGPERGLIESTIAAEGLGNSVRLLGSLSNTERYLAATDVFVLTSKNEAKPVSILEALACGVPTVAPNVGSVYESVIDNNTGYLVNDRRPDSFSQPIVKILQDRELALELGNNGRMLVQTHGSIDSMVHGYEALLWQLHCRHKGKTWPAWLGRPSRVALPFLGRKVAAK